MTKSVGQSTILTSIIPNKQSEVLKINPKQLSSEAKFILRFIENYLNQTRNATTTCRLFGITRSLFYKWLKRYHPYNLSSLENWSSRPHRARSVTYDSEVIKLVRNYREDKDTATYSARKLATIFRRDYPDQPKFHLSSSTIGRIIARFKLFFYEVIKVHKKHSRRAKKAWSDLKQRKPYNLTATQPRTLIEFDMKHIYVGSASSDRYYAFCAIDPLTKESVIHVARTSSSRQAKLAIEKVIATFGNSISILNDNGSENLGEAWQYLEEQKIVQYFARPHQPKDKPYIERLIGTYQRECLDQRRDDITNLDDLDYYTTRFLNNYHYFRPHDSLNGQTPDEYCATMNLTIERRRVSMR
jgi:transposase InsO family protein/transposase-like protein